MLKLYFNFLHTLFMDNNFQKKKKKKNLYLNFFLLKKKMIYIEVVF